MSRRFARRKQAGIAPAPGAGLCLRGNGEPDGDRGVVADVDDEESVGDGSIKIVCNTCGHRLTDDAARITVEGAHRHAKVNPHGHVFDIACFRPVPGVETTGMASSEFSWFSGYRWQIGLCGGCQVHLGWVFEATDRFWALILGRFVEDRQG